MLTKHLIFDLDNTLVDCSIYYVNAQEEFAEKTSKRLGLPKDFVLKMLTSIDVMCTSLEHGFSKIRFPRSFSATSAALDLIAGRSIDERAAEEAYLLGETVFDAPYPLYEGADKTLERLKNRGHILYLITKGDYEVQLRKIEKNGLFKWFERSRVYILPQKTAESIWKLQADHYVPPEDLMLIGDSLRDDIGSANRAGISSVWVRGNANIGWAYENEENHPTYIVETVNDLPALNQKHFNESVVVS